MKNREAYINSELPHSGFLAKLFDTNDPLIIFDVGACECEDSVRYKKLFPHSEIHAFEPLPQNIPLISDTLKRFSTDRISSGIHIVTQALSDKPGNAEFYVSSGTPFSNKPSTDWNYGNKSSSLLRPDQDEINSEWKWLKFNDKIEVKTTTLDIYAVDNHIKKIDILSIDVQGAELQVLKGGLKTLKSTGAIWLEVSNVKFYDSQPLADDIRSFMITHGFILVARIGKGKQFDELYVSLNHPKIKEFKELIIYPYTPVRYLEKTTTEKKIKKSIRRQLGDTVLGQTEIETNFGTKNVETREIWLEEVLSVIRPGSTILDAGAGNTRYRNFCQHLIYTSQDFNQYDGKGDGLGIQTGIFDQKLVDIVSDIVNIPVENCSFDNIMCIEVLEHIPDPISAIKEFHRILKPGGKLIVSAPFASLTHFSPYFYQTGYSQYFYRYWYNILGFTIDDLSYNGSYYSWLAQELRRLPSINSSIHKHKGLSRERRKSLKVMIDWLEEMECSSCKANSNPSELLCYGLQVIAHKNDI